MKNIFLGFVAMVQVIFVWPQTAKITIEPAIPGITRISQNISNGGKFQVSKNIPEVKAFKLEFGPLAASHKLIISVSGATIVGGSPNDEYSQAESPSPKLFSFSGNIVNKQVTITDDDGTTRTAIINFNFIKAAGVRVPGLVTNNDKTIEPLTDYLTRVISNYELTPMGWIRNETSGMTEKEKRQQINTTHIFLDEYGNSLLGTMPQGISNRQYVAHIIYQGYSDKQRGIRYSVKQKTGSFNSGLTLNNTGILGKVLNLQSGEEEDPFDEWKEEMFPLGVATDDLSFDIIATTEGDDSKLVKVVLETQTIKMSPVYHATFDIGLINSELKNSTFSLVDAPDGSANKVVQETDRSPKGIVTVMATFYTSPIVIIEKLFEKRLKKRIPNYKLTGRNFFDDHSFLERIYPTVGVSISSKTFENLFFGLNWELARGLSVFGGGHWGRVNTFEMPNITTGVTPVTQQQFDFYKNTKWKVDWAYGAKLDILIITNLFK